MSFSRIRNRIESLERKLALPLAVVRLRPLVEEFCWQWQVATVERKSLPDPHSLIQKIASKGLYFSTFGYLRAHLERQCEKSEEPDPQDMIKVLLPMAYRRSIIWNVFSYDAPAEI